MRYPRPRGCRIALLGAILGLGSLGAASVRAQEAGRVEPLPQGHLFQPLLADPKQPHFFAAWLWVTSPLLTGQVSNVGLGEDVGLIRGRRKNWEVSVAAATLSQFNMESPSNDLINTDFLIGLPFTYRRGALSVRARIYHQSSHLGDEFVLGGGPPRVNLSFEALELLVSRDVGRVRLYGGGEHVFRREPGGLKSKLLHGGIEYRAGRLIAALDAKSIEERKWRVGWSGCLGVEFRPARATAGRRLSLQLQAYAGPAPYGQFYEEDVKAVGLGIHFSL